MELANPKSTSQGVVLSTTLLKSTIEVPTYGPGPSGASLAYPASRLSKHSRVDLQLALPEVFGPHAERSGSTTRDGREGLLSRSVGPCRKYRFSGFLTRAKGGAGGPAGGTPGLCVGLPGASGGLPEAPGT